MSLLADLKTVFDALEIPVETGVFSDKAPDTYTVLTPIADRYEVFADNIPEQEVEEVRVSIYSKNNYRPVKRQIEGAILSAGLTVTGRVYVGHEDDTGYHHYAIDVANNYETEVN